MNKKKLLLLLLLCLVPSIVLADSSSSGFPLVFALVMETFVTIHMTVFVLIPLSKIFGGNNSKKLFNIMFFGRILLLLYFDLFVTPAVAFGDFIAVFLGAFIVVPICGVFVKVPEKKKEKKAIEYNSTKKTKPDKIFVRCSYCGKLAYFDDGTCDSCGAGFTENDILKDWR